MDAPVELPSHSVTHEFVAARAPGAEGLHSQILDELGKAICEGRMPAGSTITTEELENRYLVSRSVIRESLRALAAMGMVTSKRRVGNVILPMSEWNVYDLSVIRWRLAGRGRIAQLRSLTQLRAAIEPEAAKLAATGANLSQASDLMGLAGRLWAAGRSGDEDLFLELDIAFHALVMEMSGNEMFSRLNNLVSEVLIGRTHYGLMPKYPHSEALQLHVDVANAVQSGKPDAAGTAMLAIMTRTFTEMGQVWDDREPEGNPMAIALTPAPTANTRRLSD
ncbi:MAG: DNA-binding transcriptional regulator, FadR family [Microbacteriaceae bacterium]|nr:DNA-binding transcriptional regulator, FadR family [Microbacteriaceae bacterium]HEV7957370.1 FCD domain-containing protein [Marisediminicola sp.]